MTKLIVLIESSRFCAANFLPKALFRLKEMQTRNSVAGLIWILGRYRTKSGTF